MRLKEMFDHPKEYLTPDGTIPEFVHHIREIDDSIGINVKSDQLSPPWEITEKFHNDYKKIQESKKLVFIRMVFVYEIDFYAHSSIDFQFIINETLARDVYKLPHDKSISFNIIAPRAKTIMKSLDMDSDDIDLESFATKRKHFSGKTFFSYSFMPSGSTVEMLKYWVTKYHENQGNL
jgi:hypothetical protein